SSAARALRESIFSRLAGRLQSHGADGVPLHLGDTYLAPPPAARLPALRPAMDELYRYGTPAGEAPLLGALARKLRRQNGLGWGAATASSWPSWPACTICGSSPTRSTRTWPTTSRTCRSPRCRAWPSAR